MDINSILKYEKLIKEIYIEDLIPNNYNPRARFNEEEEEELIDSILSKGILDPIIVYHDPEKNKYIILDGERRYKACKKINIKKIPARILLKEPDLLESLSIMFHIHNVREDWTEFAISMTIRKIIEEMGKEISNISSNDLNELSRITSLSKYKINKYMKFQDYPQSVIQKFLESEILYSNEEKPDPDILLEMHKPLKDIKVLMPELYQDYNVEKIIDICIEKKQKEIIKTNKEFRLISKSLTAAKKGELEINLLKQNIIRFLNEEKFTPEDLYQNTSESIYRYQSILRTSKSLFDLLTEFKVNSFDSEKRSKLIEELNRLLSRIREIQ